MAPPQLPLLPSLLLFLCGYALWAQHNNHITATLDEQTHQIHLRQHFTYKNHAQHSLSELYFNDWNHAYANKNTALAKRFAEEFNRSLHLAKQHERGYTQIKTIVDKNHVGINWKRIGNRDIIRLDLDKPLAPGDSLALFFTYTVQLPNARFTSYGVKADGGYHLKNWYLTPAVFQNGWKLYDNLNLNDSYTDVMQTTLHFTYPKTLFLATNFTEKATTTLPQKHDVHLHGTHRKTCEIILSRDTHFTEQPLPSYTVVTDLKAKQQQDPAFQGTAIHKITQFLEKNLGPYPHPRLLVTETAYNKNPLYGLNQLPAFIRPYEETFQFEMKFLKTALQSFLTETLFLDPRAERWVTDAISIYLMAKYVDEQYPKQKLVGKLSTLWGFRNFHLAHMAFNEQYALLSMFSVRKNIDQALTTRNDSLIKFNQKIANSYKAGLGMAYLAEYLGQKPIDSSIQKFYTTYRLQPRVKASDFRKTLQQCTDKNIDWFFQEYVATDKKIDFTLKKVQQTKDSISLVIKNKRGTPVPISLFGLRNDTVVSHYWFSDIHSTKAITLPNKGEERLALNYDQKIPEINQRNNWKSLNGFFSSDKKIKFQFFKDTENPYYHQIFYIPILSFNLYDGLTPGIRLSNKTFLERPFTYNLSPIYSFSEQTLIGNASISYRKYHNKTGLYRSAYSLSGATSHFQKNSRFTTVTPAISLSWRPDHLISNHRQTLLLRYKSVTRTIDQSVADQIDTTPDYNVLNLRYADVNNNMLHYTSWFVDAQHANNFTKLAFETQYRKLLNNNRQINLRFYAGKFLKNNTNSDFFSFALDRPTDYMFDLSYLGRSEDAGIYSQQIIITEGGFKSKLKNPFANDWMVTTNASTNLWRWVEVYGDLGWLRNKGENPRFVYDSGIRLNLVTDYFELYFPVYSNRGWEIAQQPYAERIRFVITLSPRTLIGLFTRKWF